MAPGFFARVYEVVARIPRGRVMTYGAVAAVLGHPRGARIVGWALRALAGRSDHRVPWHRVVARGGKVSLPGPSGRRQRARLRAEGVRFRGSCISPAPAAPGPRRKSGTG
jgi:methylated-DNA-protein-cysteine methyltransferase-like protein